MIVYNLSIKVNHEITDKWVDWQMREHIPEIMGTGLFTHYNFFRLLEQDEEDGSTYIIQYYTNTIEDYNSYIQKFAPLLRQKALIKWDDGLIIFRTLMETVQ